MYNTQPKLTIDYSELMRRMANIPENQLNFLVDRARKIGIPEASIQEGLSILKQHKGE